MVKLFEMRPIDGKDYEMVCAHHRDRLIASGQWYEAEAAPSMLKLAIGDDADHGECLMCDRDLLFASIPERERRW